MQVHRLFPSSQCVLPTHTHAPTPRSKALDQSVSPSNCCLKTSSAVPTPRQRSYSCSVKHTKDMTRVFFDMANRVERCSSIGERVILQECNKSANPVREWHGRLGTRLNKQLLVETKSKLPRWLGMHSIWHPLKSTRRIMQNMVSINLSDHAFLLWSHHSHYRPWIWQWVRCDSTCEAMEVVTTRKARVLFPSQ